jgi:hypothetical protein
MNLKKIILPALCALTLGSGTYAQYLSNLNAAKDDPLYTVYAAPMERSQYKIDQGYALTWFDPEEGISLTSSNGGNLCIAYRQEGKTVSKLKEFYKEPVITASYSDIVKFYFYPFKNIRVEGTYNTYSSQGTLQDLKVVNESGTESTLEVYPYFFLPNDTVNSLELMKEKNAVVFNHRKNRDGWMKDQKIPLVEDLKTAYVLSGAYETYGVYGGTKTISMANLLKGISKDSLTADAKYLRGVVLKKSIKLAAGALSSVRVVRYMDAAGEKTKSVISDAEELFEVDPQSVIKEDEKIYSQIPAIKNVGKDEEMMYWSSFSLIRQCMMPAEGECGYNYYVFSREPKWGWGYGGQVFHESLVMLAYALMDPEGAMNSQRVYMERQRKDGYINYRTGPYLNENIEYEGEFTSSAPWYNYQNWEVYKITKDKSFLKDSYESGKKFYNYYVSNRDKDKDGLCEWGAHAVLESVRDAFVAVWDKIDWPSKFEGPDVNAMLVSEAKALAAMAKELGKTEEAAAWEKDAATRTELINKYMWDEETGFYYNIDMKDNDFTYKNNNDLKIKEIIGFLPMWAGVAPKDRADKLMKSMLDKEEFWREFGIPTLTAKDDYYNPLGYWNGPVWVPWQYLMFRGLEDYSYNNEAKELYKKVSANIINQLKRDHYLWEFYSADDYQAGWNKAYIWTGIIARMLYDETKLK